MMQWFDSPAHWYVIGFAGQLAFLVPLRRAVAGLRAAEAGEHPGSRSGT